MGGVGGGCNAVVLSTIPMMQFSNRTLLNQIQIKIEAPKQSGGFFPFLVFDYE